MEEAISRLTLALEELDEFRREEEVQRCVGANWRKIARTIDRLLTLTIDCYHYYYYSLLTGK